MFVLLVVQEHLGFGACKVALFTPIVAVDNMWLSGQLMFCVGAGVQLLSGRSTALDMLIIQHTVPCAIATCGAGPEGSRGAAKRQFDLQGHGRLVAKC